MIAPRLHPAHDYGLAGAWLAMRLDELDVDSDAVVHPIRAAVVRRLGRWTPGRGRSGSMACPSCGRGTVRYARLASASRSGEVSIHVTCRRASCRRAEA